MTYSIEEVAGQRTTYVVRDHARNALARGKFHTRVDAQRWIDRQVARAGAGRASVHQSSSVGIPRDYYGDNERLIRELA